MRRPSRWWLAGTTATVALALALARLDASPSAPAKSEQEALQANGCGVERWSVKTLTDPSARTVNFTPRATTIDALRLLPGTHVSFGTPRQRPVETATYRVSARLVAMKVESDRDIHLIVASPATGRTMIVEFPNTTCTYGALHRSAMASARARLEAVCGAASPSSFRSLSGTATLSGIGFVDLLHGQRGVAPNGIELHPVLSFRATSC